MAVTRVPHLTPHEKTQAPRYWAGCRPPRHRLATGRGRRTANQRRLRGSHRGMDDNPRRVRGSGVADTQWRRQWAAPRRFPTGTRGLPMARCGVRLGVHVQRLGRAQRHLDRADFSEGKLVRQYWLAHHILGLPVVDGHGQHLPLSEHRPTDIAIGRGDSTSGGTGTAH